MADPRIKSTVQSAILGAVTGAVPDTTTDKPSKNSEAPAKAHRSAGPSDHSLEARSMRASLGETAAPPPPPFDRQLQRVERLKAELPVWKDEWRKLHVKNRLGMKEFPTLEEANLYPTVRIFDDHNRTAAEYFDAASDAFRAGKTSQENGNPADAKLCFDAGQALTRGGLQHVKRNEQWNRLRLDHDRRTVDQAMIIDPSIALIDTLAWEMTFSAAGAVFGAFRHAYQIARLGRTEASVANVGRREFAELLNDSERLAKTSPEALASLSKVAGGEGLELAEASRLIDAARLPGQRATVIEQGSALRSEILDSIKNIHEPEQAALRELLRDEARLSRANPEALQRLGRCVGLSKADANVLIRSADLHRYAEVDGMNWKEAIQALEQMGDKQAATELRDFANEIRGHHTAVSLTGRELNVTLSKMNPRSVKELETGFGLGEKEAVGIHEDLTSLNGKGVQFTNHDLLSVGGKTNTRVGRNMGKAVGREDPNLREVIELHNRCNDHHAHLTAAGGPKAIAEARVETAVDLVAAWRQKRAYKESWSWEKIDAVIANPKATDPWATDHALRGWLKVASREMKQMEAGGFPLAHPETYIKLQPGQFLYE